MKHYKNSIIKEYLIGQCAMGIKVKYLFIMVLLILGITSCSDFVEVDPPKNNLVSETVFEDPATVESALANIYYKMREQGMVSGRFGFSVLLSLYSDEQDYYNSSADYLELYNNNVTSQNTLVTAWWSHAYNMIYVANDIISGVEASQNLSVNEKRQFRGQALFIRGYIHSLLVSLYGDIPYITTTNYLINNKVSRQSVNEVYDFIISDLIEASELMNDADASGEHVIPNASVAQALLSRIYLYTEQWELAEATANDLIESHSLELDINQVFLKDSEETLWQFKPNGVSDNNTYEANQFVIRFIPGQTYALSDALLASFEPGDLRFTNWTGSLTSSDGLTTLYFAHKYKVLFDEMAALEYSIIFRLTEQYLIRAESRAQLGDIAGALEDLNAIRNRAGLVNSVASTKNELLEAVLQERRVEFFTEHGHRWFDLKRFGVANSVLSSIKANWQDTDVLFPIPETELEVNPNLKPQNAGY